MLKDIRKSVFLRYICMKKQIKKIADFFAFTRSERRGIVALLGILGFFMTGIQVIPLCYSKPPELAIFEDLPERKELHKAQTASPQSPTNNTLSKPKSFKSAREKKVFTVQANACDTLDLQQIRGIGSAFSKRIVKYRDQLGGFVRKEQLLEVWGMDSVKYAQIEGAFIIDKQNIRKINLNTASINDLKRHPYLDYYQAKAIVQTRESQGFYTNVEDILKIALMDEETFGLICEYLEI